MRLIGYGRVSRVAGREGESFQSPTQQRHAVEAYAIAHGHEVVDWVQDLDVSGGKESRPGLDAAVARIEAGEAGGLIAARLDRLTRSLSHLDKLITRAKEGGWNLVAVDFGLDFHTPNGRLVANVLGAVAEWQLQRASE